MRLCAAIVSPEARAGVMGLRFDSGQLHKMIRRILTKIAWKIERYYFFKDNPKLAEPFPLLKKLMEKK